MSRPERILMYGDPTWSSHLSDGLNLRFPDVVDCRALPAFDSTTTPMRIARSIVRANVVCRIGYRPDMRAKKDLLWDLLCNRLPGRRSFIYWIGTDVLRFTSGLEDGTTTAADVATVRRCRNLAGAKRLSDELREVGVDAQVVPYPSRMPSLPATPSPMPPTMTVLTYMSDARLDFYGWREISAAARALPDIRFIIMGATGLDADDTPPNVSFVGWVEDPRPLYESASVVVRLVEHDGAGLTMAEGLAHGRPTIYSMPHEPHTIYVPFGDAGRLVAELSRLSEQHLSGGIPLDVEGHDFAVAEFDADKRFARLLEILLA